MTIPRLLALLAGALLLAGCGGGSKGNGVAEKSAEEIVAAATAASKEASSVHVHGSTTSGDQPLEVDVHLVADEGGEGHISANGLSFDMVRIGDTAYFTGGDELWRQFGGEAAVQLLHGRWLQAPANAGELASFTPLTDIEQLFEGILGDHGTLTKGEETTVDGKPAIAVESSKGGTLYVSTEDEPYPLKLENTGNQPGSITFDGWNESYELEAPSDAIDFSKLQS